MDNVMNCGSHGWFMLASGLLISGVLVLAGAALVKFLFFSGRGATRQ